MKQEQLNKYFSTVWKSNLDQYKYSGWALIDKVHPYETVLDVGCGFNEFRQRMPNLLGIDPANNSADYKVSIEDYTPTNKFDVAFCLGSINFGSDVNIINQIKCVSTLLNPKARIYWRCNPGLHDHGNQECNDIDFYPWTIEKHIEFADLFEFNLVTACWDTNNRIYAEWSR
jgi:hypothetical protein